ncbi:hypothetical protein OGAPHI_005029 [Ogataea philodendri]|uniref:Fe2OG dioxygenase domain-containing protein n=1 Tax=Ogataea philodendri TaxID=1378263 RepID=A0A9P8P145_9ASCO|nr:uncharacterized protein OGAPHI_005029 [Ogataea philodendri]KAH3663628.1 hypothetical protein OGAPHI_005029 [Ogataea philodendri]
METEEKLNYLHTEFPVVAKEALLELLVAFEGSVDQTVKVLEEQFDRKASGTFKTGANVKKRSRPEPVVPEHKDIPGVLSSLIEKVPEAKKQRVSVNQSTFNVPKTITRDSVILYNKQEIESIPYLKFYKNFLPGTLADELLDELLAKKVVFRDKHFFIAQNECHSNHQSTVFYEKPPVVVYDSGFYNNGEEMEQPFTGNIRTAKFLIEDEVNEVLATRERHPLEIQSDWSASLCVGNYFHSNKNNIDWHSDRLTSIGPLPIICSLNLGATRIFRLRKQYGKPITYSIPLPHNSLLIMLPGTQEEFKHCVPSLTDSLHATHPVAKEARINLTLRMQRLNMQRNLPKCPLCKSSMTLRRMFKKPQLRGYYFWLCSGGYRTGKECSGFYFANLRDIDKPKSKLYTRKVSEASRWLAPDDDEARNAGEFKMEDLEDSAVQ